MRYLTIFILIFFVTISYTQILTIGNNGTYTSTETMTYTGITLGNNSTIEVIDNHTLTIDSDITVSNGLTIEIAQNATLIITGLLTGDNNINLVINGTLVIGNVSLNNNADLTVSGTGELIVLGSFSTGNNASVLVEGDMNIEGDLTFDDGSVITIDGTLTIDGEYLGPDIEGDGTVIIVCETYFTWTGNTSTAWTTASNWSTGSLPKSCSQAIIPNVTNQPVISSNVTIASLTVDAEADITVSSNSLTVTEAFDQFGTMNIANATVNVDGPFDASGGTIDFTHTSGVLVLSSSVTSLGTLDDAMGTVEYDGGAQSVLTDSYYNLSIATAGTKTAGGNIDVNGNLTTASTATCKLNMDIHRLNIAGNLTIEAINGLDASNTSSLLTLDGSINQILSGSELTNVTIDKPGGDVILNDEISLDGKLTLTSGNIDASTNNLVLTANASVSGASDASHVRGNVAKTTTSTSQFIFPVGDGTSYRPIAITPSNTDETTWTANYQNTAYGDLEVDPPLQVVSDVEYWNLDRSGVANGTVTLWWDENSTINTNDLSELSVAHYNNESSLWEDAGNSGTTGNSSAGSVSSSAEWNSYSPFTIGSSDAMALPVTYLGMVGVCSDDGDVDLSWRTASEQNSSHFEVERSNDGFEWVQIGTVPATGFSNQKMEYDYQDINASKYFDGYYRLRQVDFDGKEEVLAPIAIFCENEKEITMEVYPNPTAGSTGIYVNYGGETNQSTELVVTDSFGKIVTKQSIVLTTGDNIFDINLENCQQGIYTVFLETQNDKFITKRLAKY